MPVPCANLLHEIFYNLIHTDLTHCFQLDIAQNARLFTSDGGMYRIRHLAMCWRSGIEYVCDVPALPYFVENPASGLEVPHLPSFFPRRQAQNNITPPHSPVSFNKDELCCHIYDKSTRQPVAWLVWERFMEIMLSEPPFGPEVGSFRQLNPMLPTGLGPIGPWPSSRNSRL